MYKKYLQRISVVGLLFAVESVPLYADHTEDCQEACEIGLKAIKNYCSSTFSDKKDFSNFHNCYFVVYTPTLSSCNQRCETAFKKTTSSKKTTPSKQT